MLSPDLQNDLVSSILKSYSGQFKFFFKDYERQNFADKVFERKILSNLDCQIFIEDSEIVAHGSPFKYLYFLYKNSVTIVDHSKTYQLCNYPEGSFFGDY